MKRAFLVGLDPHTCYPSPSPTSLRLTDGFASSGAPGVSNGAISGSECLIDNDNISSSGQKWNLNFPTDEYCNQLHSERIDEVDFKSLDPSLTLGYYFRTRDEFDQFYADLHMVNQSKLARKERPLFTIDIAPPPRPGLVYDDNNDDEDKSVSKDDDEYVFI